MPAIFCAACTAVRMARSVSCMAQISPKRTPRDRVVAAPITRKPDCPASEPISPSSPCVPGAVEAQHKAGDLGGADVENGDHAALHRRLAHVPHLPLALVKIIHRVTAPKLV